MDNTDRKFRWTWLDVVILVAVGIAAAIAARFVAIDGFIGLINDDAAYAVYAKALHDGLGFVDTTLPNNPVPPRYPIGFPAAVALFLTGAQSLAEIIARLQWVGPLCYGLMLAATYAYFRRQAGLAAGFAIAGALAIGLNGMVFTLGGLLVSDAFFTLVSLPVIVYLERLIRQERSAGWAWGLGGGLIALVCLTRYIGVTLLVALGLVLLLRRRWGALFQTAAGFAIAFAPWLVFRAMVGGEEYHSTLGFLMDKDWSLIWQNFGISSALLFITTLPGFVLPHVLREPTIPVAIGGLVVSAVMALGAFAGISRPRAGQTPLGPMYLAVTTALVLAWMVRYVLTGESATVRLLLPIAPFAVLAFGRGLAEIRDRLSVPPTAARGLGAVAAAIVVLHAGYQLSGVILDPFQRYVRDVQAHRYQQAFAYIRENLPQEARLIGLKTPAAHLFTGRKGTYFSWEISNLRILKLMQAQRSDYMLGLPFGLATPERVDKSKLPEDQRHGIDASVVIINDLVEQYPGLLEPVYFVRGGTIGLFKINQEKLAHYLESASEPEGR